MNHVDSKTEYVDEGLITLAVSILLTRKSKRYSETHVELLPQ